MIEVLLVIIFIGFIVYRAIGHPVQSVKFVGGALGLLFLGVMGIIGMILLIVFLGSIGF